MLVGHEKIIEDLKRLAKASSLPHGYIFFGGACVGKRTVAMSFANFLENGVFELPREGGVLGDAKVFDIALMKQINPDSKNSLGIDAAREIKSFLWQKPNRSPRRVAVIDDGEFLTIEAQNALLKITEEPPASTLLILITSDLDGLLPTISSRLEKLYFSTVPEKSVAEWLRKIFPKERTTDMVAKRSSGKPGLARRLIEDKEFIKSLEIAENLLNLQSGRRRDFVKSLLKSDGFNLNKLLDAMIIYISSSAALTQNSGDKNKINFWHRLLELRRNSANFGLNPRLQLEALFS